VNAATPLPASRRGARAARRATVLAAATTEFADRGLHGASTLDVARRAGLSEPYVARLFPSKQDLFVAVCDRCFARLTAAVAPADGAAPSVEDTRRALLDHRQALLGVMQGLAACGDETLRVAVAPRFIALAAAVGARAGAGPASGAALLAEAALLAVGIERPEATSHPEE
jgi:AcrR family transcriptional regulator